MPADIVFVVGEKSHPVFTRDGNDLTHTAKISLADALCGCTVKIPYLDGTTIEVPISDVVTPGFTKLVRWEGRSGGRARRRRWREMEKEDMG